MSKLRHRPVQRFIQSNLLGRIGEMIVAANYMRDLHQRVVNHDHVVVHRHPRRSQDDRVAHHFIRKFDLAVNNIVKANRPFRNVKTNRARITC